MRNLGKMGALISKNQENKKYFKRFLELALLVDNTYHHIEQLDTLGKLFKGGMSDYIKEYFPDENELCKMVDTLVSNTKFNKYLSVGSQSRYPTIYDAYEGIYGELPIKYQEGKNRQTRAIRKSVVI